MGLKEDAMRTIISIFGKEAAKQIASFENPDKYPKDFLDECVYFMSDLMGSEATKIVFGPLYRKYIKPHRGAVESRSRKKSGMEKPPFMPRSLPVWLVTT